MDEFPSNSNKAKENRAEPIEFSGQVSLKKKTKFEKFADAFIATDRGSIKSYIFMDVIIPAIKKATWDVITSALDMFLYGGQSPSMKNSSNRGSTYINYNSINTNNKQPARINYGYSNNIFDFDSNLEFDNQMDAVNFINTMNDILSRYNIVTVSDVYDLLRIPIDNYQATKYGWVDLRDARPQPGTNRKWYVKLPKPYPID